MSAPRFRWVSASKGPLCHNMKCEKPALHNRLCAFHNAMWMSQGYQPPTPTYGEKVKNVLDGLVEEKQQARQMVETISSWPVRTTSDVRQLRDAHKQCEALVKMWTKQKHEALGPYEDYIRRIDKAYEPIIQSCSDAAEIAKRRVEQAAKQGLIEDEDPDPHPTTPPKRRAGGR